MAENLAPVAMETRAKPTIYQIGAPMLSATSEIVP